MTAQLDQLIDMSRTLGDPREDLVILGEGNTSVRADGDSFWVKASGTELADADHSTFVQVGFAPVLAAMEKDSLSDNTVKQLLRAATLAGERSPSIETFLHAMCLQLDGVQFVGHTHPTAAVSLLSLAESRKLFSGSIFPDQIVLLGPSYVYVPYTDPGLPLAHGVQRALQDFLDQQQRVPRVVLLENHGVIALGGTAQEVINITRMLVKTCRILLGTLAAGGPRFLSQVHVDRIDNRPDELARRAGLR